MEAQMRHGLWPFEQLPDNWDGPAPTPRDPVEEEQRREAVKDLLSLLPPSRRYLLMLRFWRGKTHVDIAFILGLAPERVRQIEREALRELRELLDWPVLSHLRYRLGAPHLCAA